MNRPAISFLLFLFCLAFPFPGHGQTFATHRTGSEEFITYNGHDYKLLIPKAGLGWNALVDMGTSLGEGAGSVACMYTLGWSRNLQPDYFAMEGVLTRPNAFTDIGSLEYAPANYSFRLFLNPKIADAESVVVPDKIISDVERLAGAQHNSLYSDYSVVFLFERKYGGGILRGCQKVNFIDQYIPIGHSFDADSFMSDAAKKAKAALDIFVYLSQFQ